MDVENLLSGLIGAIVGVIGAVWLQGRDRAEARRMACRAVYIEMKGNAAAMATGGRPGLTSLTAWQSQFPLVLASVGLDDGIVITVACKAVERYLAGDLDTLTVMEMIAPALAILQRKAG